MKMTNRVSIFFFTICFFITTTVHALMTNVPNILSAPVVMYDEGGNVLPNGTVGVTIHLKDGDGSVLYQEEQNVNVWNGVALITIGDGYEVGSNNTLATGGLSYDIFQTSNNVTVEILVDGQLTTHTIATLGSQPYAFISDYALQVAPDSVGSLSIVDGSIVSADLDAGFLSELQSTIESNVSVTAANVSIPATAGLNNSGSLTVEGVLKDLDRAIESLRDIDLAQSIANLTASVQTQIDAVTTNLATTLNSYETTASHNSDVSGLQTQITNVVSGTTTGADGVTQIDGLTGLQEQIDNIVDGDTPIDSGPVEVTDPAPSNPDANTLYKDNMIFAWASVTANSRNPIATAAKTADFNISAVTGTVGSTASGGLSYNNYDLTFQNPATSGSLLVLATRVDGTVPSGNSVSVGTQDNNHVEIRVFHTIDSNEAENFNVLVIGY